MTLVVVIHIQVRGTFFAIHVVIAVIYIRIIFGHQSQIFIVNVLQDLILIANG
jgi:hypothetical protein